MSEYIKREDALNGCKQWLEPNERDEQDTMWNHGIEACLNEIKHHVPSADVVEVVRCRECKYLKPFTSQYGAGQFCECPCSFGGQGIKKPDDYCSYGERRDDREYNNSILNARKGEE